jgi:hypothetical protein
VRVLVLITQLSRPAEPKYCREHRRILCIAAKLAILGLFVLPELSSVIAKQFRKRRIDLIRIPSCLTVLRPSYSGAS